MKFFSFSPTSLKNRTCPHFPVVDAIVPAGAAQSRSPVVPNQYRDYLSSTMKFCIDCNEIRRSAGRHKIDTRLAGKEHRLRDLTEEDPLII